MDTEEIKEVAEKIKNLTLNLESNDAREVAKRYLMLDFIENQVCNIIWTPAAIGLAWVLYAAGKWLIALSNYLN